jgi:hypothetical protein
MGMWWFVLSESVVFLWEVKIVFLELSESQGTRGSRYNNNFLEHTASCHIHL